MRKISRIWFLITAAAFAALCLTEVHAQAGVRTVTIGWTAPTANTDSTALKLPLTYNLYLAGGTAAAPTYTKLQSAIRFTSAVVTNVPVGTNECVVLTTVDANGSEGPKSAPIACLLVTAPPPPPAPVPGAPTAVTITVSVSTQ